MKKTYYSPQLECSIIVKGGVLLEGSGTNNDGYNGENNPNIGGTNGNFAPRRRVF